MKLKLLVFAFLASMTLSSCDWLFGQHNEAAAQGRNLSSDRIYGDKDGDPKQLGGDIKGSKEDQERAQKIREKLYGE